MLIAPTINKNRCCMSLEARVKKLEEHHKQMDANLHSLVKVTAEIKNIALTNQHDIAGLKSAVAALAEATHSGFKKADEQHNEFVKETRERFDQFETRFDKLETRFDQLELLIRQLIPNN